MDAVHFLSVSAELGEGPVWIDDSLWFVDIKRCRIYRHTPACGQTNHWEAPEFVGWILPAAQRGMIAGLKSGPHRFSPEDGSFIRIATVDAHLDDNRLNDAAIDCEGRLFFGTMDNAEEAPSGGVFMLDRGVVTPTTIEKTVITNGPAIPPTGDCLYHVDTLARAVVRHAIAEDGSIGTGDTFLRFTGNEGHPDGAICDAEGGVWIGFYGGWAARRFAADGAMTDEVRFPVANVTKIAIGGTGGHTAFATTARQGLNEADLLDQPLAGDIFTFPVRIQAAALTRANS